MSFKPNMIMYNVGAFNHTAAGIPMIRLGHGTSRECTAICPVVTRF